MDPSKTSAQRERAVTQDNSRSNENTLANRQPRGPCPRSSGRALQHQLQPVFQTLAYQARLDPYLEGHIQRETLPYNILLDQYQRQAQEQRIGRRSSQSNIQSQSGGQRTQSLSYTQQSSQYQQNSQYNKNPEQYRPQPSPQQYNNQNQVYHQGGQHNRSYASSNNSQQPQYSQPADYPDQSRPNMDPMQPQTPPQRQSSRSSSTDSPQRQSSGSSSSQQESPRRTVGMSYEEMVATMSPRQILRDLDLRAGQPFSSPMRSPERRSDEVRAQQAVLERFLGELNGQTAEQDRLFSQQVMTEQMNSLDRCARNLEELASTHFDARLAEKGISSEMYAKAYQEELEKMEKEEGQNQQSHDGGRGGLDDPFGGGFDGRGGNGGGMGGGDSGGEGRGRGASMV